MTDFWKHASERWQDSANVLLGVWLVVSAWVLGFTEVTTAFYNALFFGAVLAIAAFAAIVNFHKWEEWLGALVGAWLIVSPWFLGFGMFEAGGAATAATWNTLITGILALGLAGWSLWNHQGGAHA